MKTLLLAACVAGTLLTAACSPGLAVDSYPTRPGTAIDCKALFADAPSTVAGEDLVAVEDSAIAVAWGAPPIIMRCGVESPAILDPDAEQGPPQCNYVDGVDWVSETTADGYLFTTIGRRFFVSLEVPSAYDPAADALADVADAVKLHDPSVTPCRS